MEIWYYTDLLVEKQKPIWEEELPKWIALNPQLSNDEALQQVQRRHPAGTYINVSFFGDKLPTADKIRLLALSKAPWFWLDHQEKLITNSMDCNFDHLRHMENVELNGFKEEIDLLLDEEKKELNNV
jgi:hypothetical protein